MEKRAYLRAHVHDGNAVLRQHGLICSKAQNLCRTNARVYFCACAHIQLLHQQTGKLPDPLPSARMPGGATCWQTAEILCALTRNTTRMGFCAFQPPCPVINICSQSRQMLRSFPYLRYPLMLSCCFSDRKALPSSKQPAPPKSRQCRIICI